MSDILQTISPDVLPSNSAPVTINLPGDGNTLIAHADTVNTRNIFIPVVQTNGVKLPTRRTINEDYYNLFVIGGEMFNGDHFIVPKGCALTKSIMPELKKRYAKLDKDAIAEIKTFPAIFANTNHNYRRADENQVAYIGFVNDVSIQDNGIKVCFHPLFSVSQCRLNELASTLSIKSASAVNEFDNTHWTIKQLNLIEKLHNNGIKTLF